MRLVLLVSLVILVAQTVRTARLLTEEEGCGFSPEFRSGIVRPRIIGGFTAPKGTFPWIALLVYTENGKIPVWPIMSCGGSLITSKHVMTAAHCIKPSLTHVRLGEHDIFTVADGPHEDIKIVRVNVHPKHDRLDNTNDIAILTLEREVSLSSVRPVCLPMKEPLRSNKFENTKPYVAGWGKMFENARGRTAVLQMLQVPVIDNETCKRELSKIYKVKSAKQFSDLVLCAGYLEGGRDSCQGDSGGPLMLPQQRNGEYRVYQIGVVSWGIGCARAGSPGVYTRVSRAIDWIQETIKD